MLVAVASVSACAQPDFDYAGTDLTAVKLGTLLPGEGVHPSRTALDAPENPFSSFHLSPDEMWQLGDPAASPNPAVGFFAFASCLAYSPRGELQLHTAGQLMRILDTCVPAADGTPSTVCGFTPDEQAAIKTHAAEGLQSLLDNFPDDVSYTAEGYQYRLAPIAIERLRALGVPFKGNWIVIDKPTGIEAVRY
jgi:hypothetical protein